MHGDEAHHERAQRKEESANRGQWLTPAQALTELTQVSVEALADYKMNCLLAG